MRIRELRKNEINEIEEKINELRDSEYYKYYFHEGEQVNSPDNAYLLDECYYIDFTYYDDICYFGIIKLNNNKCERNSYYELMDLFNKKLQHYKKIMMWCYIENKTAYKFHKHLIKKYKTKHYENEGFSVLEVDYEFKG